MNFVTWLILLPFLGFVLGFLIVFIVSFLSTQTLGAAQLTSVEGGFTAGHYQWSKGSSIPYYLLVLLFLLFDVELVVILPLIASLGITLPVCLLLLGFVGGSVLVEWWLGSLQWVVLV